MLSSPGVYVEPVRPDAFVDALVVSERCAGLEQVRVIGLAGTAYDRMVEMDDPVYSAWLGDNLEFDPDHFRFGYTSLVVPPTAYDEPFESGTRTLVKRTPVLGGYDPANYTSEDVSVAGLAGWA